MDEFRNRMAAQREILRVVNGFEWGAEQLCGLSDSAISRWVEANQLGANSEVASLLRQAASLLFFLATKSQEQITTEYRARMDQVAEMTTALQQMCADLERQRGL